MTNHGELAAANATSTASCPRSKPMPLCVHSAVEKLGSLFGRLAIRPIRLFQLAFLTYVVPRHQKASVGGARTKTTSYSGGERPFAETMKKL